MNIPLFPLQAVLFPGGQLPLRVFEPRYMDMATACIREQTPFGVCLIAAGAEVAAPATPHSTGTLARVANWDMEQLGILQITAMGEQRFRLLRHWTEPSGLLRGEIRLLEQDAPTPIPDDFARLVPLLHAILDELGDSPQAPAQPHRFDDADWLSLRFSELLPIPPNARQMLLEVDKAIDRLEIVYRFLVSKSLLPETH